MFSLLWIVTKDELIFITSVQRLRTDRWVSSPRPSSKYAQRKLIPWDCENRIPAGSDAKRGYYRSWLSRRTSCADIIELPGEFARRVAGDRFQVSDVLFLGCDRTKSSRAASYFSLPSTREVREKARFYHRFNPLRPATSFSLSFACNNTAIQVLHAEDRIEPVSFPPALSTVTIRFTL